MQIGCEAPTHDSGCSQSSDGARVRSKLSEGELDKINIGEARRINPTPIARRENRQRDDGGGGGGGGGSGGGGGGRRGRRERVAYDFNLAVGCGTTAPSNGGHPISDRSPSASMATGTPVEVYN
ncbi:hypothetical protein K0M31_018353 [Melipona bicolor]|uniref:Uncharacterized protein n=1 Tax=Melipona bicolor TaxID=60889 RepID=A0AA40G3B1_9HYME|nr:hypothetical protein K0M31_018353 [Melipona bicolor]